MISFQTQTSCSRYHNYNSHEKVMQKNCEYKSRPKTRTPLKIFLSLLQDILLQAILSTSHHAEFDIDLQYLLLFS